MSNQKIAFLVVLIALTVAQSDAETTVPVPPTTEEPTTTTTTPIPTTQDPIEARFILCQVMCQEQYVACTSDPGNNHYRMSLALHPDRPVNAERHRGATCRLRKIGCRDKCYWVKEQTHMYNRNCTATNFLAGLDFNKPGFSLKDELKTLKFISV